MGGELFYDYLHTDKDGRHVYRVTLKVFRDCGPNTADFDGIGPSPALLTVLAGNGGVQGVFNIGLPVIKKVPPTINSPCMTIPQTVCVEEGVYTYTLTLEPRTGGYYLVYQRCCRNHSILNLVNPGQQGSTYYAFIPGPESAAINSSPRFVDYPPVFLCNGYDFSYTQAATDPDGDQLVYKFSTPFQGLDVCCPALGSEPSAANCPNPPAMCPSAAAPVPYPPVQYQNPYHPLYPAPASPSLAIHPLTGAMSGAPMMSGQYVVNVCVEEYRGGQLIGKHFRDFQFNMVPCDGVLSQFRVPEKCQGLNFSFTNNSYKGTTFLWNFGVAGKTDDTSTTKHPTYVYQDTGRYVVTLIVNPGKPCSDTEQKVIKVYPPLAISFEQPKPQCLTQNNFSFSTRGTYGTATKFRWDLTSSADPSKASTPDVANVTFSTSGTYFVKLQASHFACVDSFIDTVHVLPEPRAGIADPGLLCEPALARFTNAGQNDFPVTCVWKTSTGERSTRPQAEFVFEKAGEYTANLVATAFGLCEDTAEIRFVVNARPTASFEIVPSQVTILDPEVQIRSLVNDVVVYRYEFGDGSSDDYINGKHIYDSEGSYLVTQYISNFSGCTDSVSKVVKVLPEHRLWMPNVFTPDGNTLNDTFGPTVMYADYYEFYIFDRWGSLVFHSNDPVKGWDGKLRGHDCPQGVYAYRMSYVNPVDLKLVQRSGHVTLLRNP